jgi:F420H(2)-dependent quinone reductase
VRLISRPARRARLSRLHAAILRASRGRIRRSLLFAGGQPVLALQTIGRRTRKPRSTVVAYLRDGENFVVFGQNVGNRRDPAWCLNLESDPNALIDVEGKRLDVRAHRASGHEAERLWAAYAKRLPVVDRFREIAGREIPIMVLEEAPPATGERAVAS